MFDCDECPPWPVVNDITHKLGTQVGKHVTIALVIKDNLESDAPLSLECKVFH